MTKLDFLVKHRQLLSEFLDLETDRDTWVEQRSTREIHILAHFMFLCHTTAQHLLPIISRVSKERKIGDDLIPLDQL